MVTLLVDVAADLVYREGAAQCYSGTSLFEVLFRKTFGQGIFKELNRVVIFEAGHILPGYAIRNENRWHLYGVETTVAGKAVTDFGYTNDIKEPIRVVDANDFVVTEIFKRHLDSARAELMVKAILKSTADQYEIEVEALEKMIQSKVGSVVSSSKGIGTAKLTKESWSSGKINSSPFSFGSADIPNGRQPRIKADQLQPRGDHPFLSPDSIIVSVDYNVEVRDESKEIRNRTDACLRDYAEKQREAIFSIFPKKNLDGIPEDPSAYSLLDPTITESLALEALAAPWVSRPRVAV